MEPSVALVTGANRGLGLAVARGLVRNGFRVYGGVRDPSRLPGSEGILALRMDLGDEASIRAAAAELQEREGRLHILVNNAGVLLPQDKDLFALEEATLLRTLDTNLLGVWRVTRTFAPLLVRGGRIVNVSSGGGQLSSMATWAPAYCISKTALNALTVQTSLALTARGIAVNAVCPGWVRTDMGGADAPRSVEEGAASILWQVLEAPQEITGGFFRDGRPIPW